MVGVNIMCTRSAGEGSSKLYSLLGFASFFYFLYASCKLVGSLEHNFVPLLPCLGFALVTQTWVLSSLCSSSPPLLGALF